MKPRHIDREIKCIDIKDVGYEGYFKESHINKINIVNREEL